MALSLPSLTQARRGPKGKSRSSSALRDPAHTWPWNRLRAQSPQKQEGGRLPGQGAACRAPAGCLATPEVARKGECPATRKMGGPGTSPRL